MRTTNSSRHRRLITRINRHATYANVMSTISVVVALTMGTAWAATTITGRSIKDGTVTSRDLANNRGVAGADVIDGSLGTADMSSTARATLKGTQGIPGTPGAPGAQGPAGDPQIDHTTLLLPVSAAEATASDAFAAATPVKIESHGPLRIDAYCYKLTSNDTIFAQLYVELEGGTALLQGSGALPLYGGFGLGYLEPTTDIGLRYASGWQWMGDENWNMETTDVFPMYSDRIGLPGELGHEQRAPDEVLVIASDGSVISGTVRYTIKKTTPAAGDGIWGSGQSCLIDATWFRSTLITGA